MKGRQVRDFQEDIESSLNLSSTGLIVGKLYFDHVVRYSSAALTDGIEEHRLDGVTRRLLRWADCPVELLRTEQQPAAETICLLPVPADSANRLSLQRLQALPWTAGMRLHVLGVVPPGLDDGCETNAAEALLQGLQAQLEGVLPKGTSVTCEVQAGSLRTLAVQRSRQLQSQLLLLSHCCFDTPAQQGPFLSLAPESLALAVDCSVLLLQDVNAAPLPQGRTEAARVLRLAR